MNNGVVSYIDASNLPVDEGNCLLIGGKTYSISYQRQNFVSNDSHNLIIRLKPEYKQYASENVYLFLALEHIVTIIIGLMLLTKIN